MRGQSVNESQVEPVTSDAVCALSHAFVWNQSLATLPPWESGRQGNFRVLNGSALDLVPRG